MTCNIYRELWPRTADEESINPPKIFQDYHVKLDEFKKTKNITYDKEILEYSKYLFDEEENRRYNTEKKATYSLNAIGISTALIVGLATLVFEGKFYGKGIFSYLMLLCYLISIVFLVRASMLSLKVFGDIKRNYLGPDDILINNLTNESHYRNLLIEKLIKYTIENYKVNNRVLSIVHTAQACFRNAIFIIGLFGVILISDSIFLANHHSSTSIVIKKKQGGNNKTPNSLISRERAKRTITISP